MPYDDFDSYYTYDSFGYSVTDLLDSDSEISVGTFDAPRESETEYVDGDNVILSYDLLSNSNQFDVDYGTYLDDIIANQETIIANQETIIAINTEIQNNGYRLYYFVGGLYVAFAIIIMVKFFKTFLF